MLRIIAICLALCVAGQVSAKDACDIENPVYFKPGTARISTDLEVAKAVQEISVAAGISPIVCEYSPLNLPLPFVDRDSVFLPKTLKQKLTYIELRAVIAHETAHLVRGIKMWFSYHSAQGEEIAADRLAARWVGKAGLISALRKMRRMKELKLDPRDIAYIDKRLRAIRALRF